MTQDRIFEDKQKLTYLDKVKLYEKCLYLVPVPPVCPVYWGEKQWIQFIDAQGKWLKPEVNDNLETEIALNLKEIGEGLKND